MYWLMRCCILVLLFYISLQSPIPVGNLDLLAPPSDFFEKSLISQNSGTERFLNLSLDDFYFAGRLGVEPIDAKTLEDAGKFEGDMDGVSQSTINKRIRGLNDALVDPETSKEQTGAASSSNKVANNALRNTKQLWPGGKIPYQVSSLYSERARAIIAQGVQEFHRLAELRIFDVSMEHGKNKTCLRFVPHVDEKAYIFIAPRHGCYSSVGRTGGGQVVSLGNGCVHKGTVVHELMHAIGFFHEQSRADRDHWIRVKHENIRKGMEYNFAKYGLKSITHLGTPYDYHSVMHYSLYAFSKNGEPTIERIKPGPAPEGMTGLSENDRIKVNRLYRCNPGDGMHVLEQCL